MDEHRRFVEQKRLERTAKALEGNNMETHIVRTAAEVPPLVEQLVPQGAIVASGGSMSLIESGVVAHLRSGRYTYWDRDAEGADRAAEMHRAFNAEVYFASANAVTEQGEIYEMDGAGNRTAALAYGPARVILVVGRNKIVENLDAARRRNALVSAPANSHRLSLKTPCAVTGICSDCKGEARICNIELVLHRQMKKGRITVILVDEELGY